MISRYYPWWLVSDFPKRRNLIPGKLLRLAIRIYSIILNMKGVRQNYLRYIEATSVSNQALEAQGDLPTIEVLVPAAMKDLESAILTIKSISNHSINPISAVTLVVPELELEVFADAIKTIDLVPVKIVSENSLVGESLIKSIRSLYRDRAGWVLSEFIKLFFVRQSKSFGVLVMDADTILTNNRVWITRDYVQELFPVTEYHKHYFDFLRHINIPMAQEDVSFMSHYMLFQPDIYRSMLENITLSDPDSLLNALYNFPSSNPHSPVCFCYEAYSHFALWKYPEKMRLVKWGNTQVPREEFTKNTKQYLKKAQKHFNSISTHSYLRKS